MTTTADPALTAAVQAWRSPVAALVELGGACTEPDFTRPTACPGWNVKDQLSHVVGIERGLLGEPDPPLDLDFAALPHVRNELGRRTEVAVRLRQATPGQQVVAELADVLARRTDALLGGTHAPDEPTATLFGPMPLLRALALRTFDVWAHEQDVREALDRPGNLDSVAARLSIDRIRDSLPAVVARGAGVRPGATVVLRVDGPVAFDTAVRVVTVADGRPRGQTVDPDTAAPDTTLRLTTLAFTRRACGRWTPARTRAQVTGDAQLAAAVLEALAITP